MSAKIDNYNTVPKRYWSVIKKFLSNKKTPIISPVLVNDELVSDLKQKANLFNNYFASQNFCSSKFLLLKIYTR